jgi:4-deoxy-L-threo-5-hexosulose-uronate ketol-isomerase
MPVNTTLTLENFWELGLDVDNTIKEKYFLYNREIGIVNCGLGDGVVIVDGKEYALSPKEALYVGRGHIGKDQDVNMKVQKGKANSNLPIFPLRQKIRFGILVVLKTSVCSETGKGEVR